jgi:acyl carrier protein
MTTPLLKSDLDAILVRNIGLDPGVLAGPGTATLTDLGIDSIGVIELEKVLHDEFGAALPEEAPAMSVTQILTHLNDTARSTGR